MRSQGIGQVGAGAVVRSRRSFDARLGEPSYEPYRYQPLLIRREQQSSPARTMRSIRKVPRALLKIWLTTRTLTRLSSCIALSSFAHSAACAANSHERAGDG